MSRCKRVGQVQSKWLFWWVLGFSSHGHCVSAYDCSHGWRKGTRRACIQIGRRGERAWVLVAWLQHGKDLIRIKDCKANLSPSEETHYTTLNISTIVILQRINQGCRGWLPIRQFRITSSNARERKQSNISSAFHFHVLVFYGFKEVAKFVKYP